MPLGRGAKPWFRVEAAAIAKGVLRGNDTRLGPHRRGVRIERRKTPCGCDSHTRLSDNLAPCRQVWADDGLMPVPAMRNNVG